MLNEVKFIKNIGRFERARSVQNAKFGPCTLIFGENGWGKSTLAEILRSLTQNNPSIILGRRTLGADMPQNAVLKFGTHNVAFENAAWNGPRARILIYDSVFINENVFSGDLISPDHLKNQYGLVVGEEGVRRIRWIVELDDDNRSTNSAIRSAESKISAVIRTIGLSTLGLDDFLELEDDPNIETEIASQLSQIQRAQRAKEVKLASVPSLIPQSTDIAKIRELLNQTIDGIAETALNKVRAHIAAHKRDSRESEMTHEAWLETGMPFVVSENCPFCGQALLDRTLLNAYKGFFGQSYRALSVDIKNIRETLNRYKNGDYRKKVFEIYEQNSQRFQYWHEVGQIPLPELESPEALVRRMERAANELDNLFVRKQANLVESIVGSDVESALEEWENGRNQVADINKVIGRFLQIVSDLKESIDSAELSRLEGKLSVLNAIKRRYDPDIVRDVQSLESLKNRKREIASEKARLRSELSEISRKITSYLGSEINQYLERLGAGFRIRYHEPDFRGKEPSANFDIMIREVPVAPRGRAESVDKPSFRNTLSAGDKSTLALALFLAKINSDPKLNETIVVLDDPFTSLDHLRRQFTAFEVRRICACALQTIVMSHQKNFLRLLWDKIDQQKISSLALQAGAPGVTTIVPYDIATATQPRHITERTQIEEFLEGEQHDPTYIRTRLRTVCEDFYRKGDPALFHQAASLEEIIRILEGAANDHPFKGALDELRNINEYSRGDSHAAVEGSPVEDTSHEELKAFCRKVVELTRGM